MSLRKLKTDIRQILKNNQVEERNRALLVYPERRVVNALISFFYDGDQQIRWRAITGMGAVVSHLADREMESARVVMRRLMWNLNEESGGIGWGAPEAMGDIIARSAAMEKEYLNILVSYIREGGNFIEHEELQKGVLWAIGRLSHADCRLPEDAGNLLSSLYHHQDTEIRGLSLWASIPLIIPDLKPLIKTLVNDNSRLTIFVPDRFIEYTIRNLALDALEREAPFAKGGEYEHNEFDSEPRCHSC